MNVITFRDRRHAGRLLAEPLRRYAHQEDAIVLGLPRGGVPVAYEVAQALGLPLDVVVVRKLGVPGNEELAMGAVASGGAYVVHKAIVKAFHVSQAELDDAVERQRAEVAKREQLFRGRAGAPDLTDKVAILVDDGMATGSSLSAAIQAIRRQGPKAVIVAVPTASPEACVMLEPQVDELVALQTPQTFRAVGQWYEDFSQATDGEVVDLLADAKKAATHE
jgi:putative phosphoribosyl transferase